MKREILNQLESWKARKTRNPLILKGARQVGKTYALKAFGQECFARVHYFNFERQPGLVSAFQANLDPRKILQALSFETQTPIDPENDLIIFDEIQACPLALTSLKYFAEDLPGSYVCAAGSLLGIHLGPVSFPVGKVEHLSLYPMTFSEFLLASGDEVSYELMQTLTPETEIPSIAHQSLWEKLKHYFICGGLPEVVQIYCDHQQDFFTACQKIREKQLNLLEDYYADIAKHAGKLNSMHIQRVLNAVPEQLGRSQDGSAKKFKFRGVIPGVDRYSKMAGAIDWLESVGLIIKASIVQRAAIPLQSYTKENSFKLFLFDVGLLGALSELSPKTILDYDYGSYKGFFAENFVAQAFTAFTQRRLYTWEEGAAEVEFVVPMESGIIPVEVKSGWVTQAKSLQRFVEKYQPPYRVIFSAKPLRVSADKHVQCLPLYTAGQFPFAEL